MKRFLSEFYVILFLGSSVIRTFCSSISEAFEVSAPAKPGPLIDPVDSTKLLNEM